MGTESCFHCLEDIPTAVNIQAIIDGQVEKMCCHGCKAVAEFIDQEGYSEFYNYRGDSQPARKAQVADDQWLPYDEEINFNNSCRQSSNGLYTVSIRLEGVYCSACGWLIDKHLGQLKGITDVKLNTLTKLLRVEFDEKQIKLSEILTAINYLGYHPIISNTDSHKDMGIDERRKALKRLVVAGFGMMFIMTLSVPLYSAEYHGIDANIKRFFSLMSLLIATAVYFYSGKTFLQNAFRDLTNKHLGMDVPVALSISLAYGVSVWNVLTANNADIYFDSMVMFVFFLLAGRYVEMTVRHQGMSVNDALANMVPSSVNLVNGKQTSKVPIESINKGDIIQVNSGDVIAIDGVIIEGRAAINESMITGEQQSIQRSVDETVMAGSQLDSGTINIRSTALGDETILANLSQLLERAQLQKPKTLQLVDKVASWFVAIVLMLALATAIYYAFNQPDKALVTVLAVLVATCPCALSLATPAALTAASVKLMKKGILINNLDAITKINQIKQWFFDKTGTLTEPQMSLQKIHQLGDQSEQELLKLMAALEHESSHPIASAFNDYYDDSIKFDRLEEIANAGVVANINNDHYRAGTKQWCKLDTVLESQQHTVIYLTQNNQPIAAFELKNKIRKGTKQLIENLQKNQSVTILSGDKVSAVKHVASSLGVSDYYADQTPQQKIKRIKEQQTQNKMTVMIGDGINDAPVLAQSDVSISFNQGTQLARSASDFIIMGNSLHSIEELLKISKKTNRIIKQNIIWALVYNLSVTPLAMMGHLTPWMAAIGMSVSSLFVILNAKRILLS
jgi:Cu2+-exporting ATPase